MPALSPSLRIVSSTDALERPAQLLVVDDDRSMRTLLDTELQHQGYSVEAASAGGEALALLSAQPSRFDAILLDREMPEMNGMELVQHLKADAQLAAIPIIMLTGSGATQQIQEGIAAGVYYYLVKPVEHSILQSIIESALRERRQRLALFAELNRYSAALKTVRHCHLVIKHLTEAEDAACFLASCFPDPKRVVTGLMDLLVNAVEHGNLAITYEEKQALLSSRRWHEEVARRAQLPEHAAKSVSVTFQHRDEGFLVQITDSGDGFDWRRFWHINPARATASHGRGIARARLVAFDQLSYNEKGNSVTAMVTAGIHPEGAYAW